VPLFGNRKSLFRLLVILLWLVLFGALLQRDFFVKELDLHEARIIKQAQETEFIGIHFQNQRIGYVKTRLNPAAAGSGYTLFEDAVLHLNIMGEIHPIRMHLQAGLTESLLLQHFTFELASPFYQIDARGLVAGGEVDLTIRTGKETIRDTVQLASQPFLPTNQRGYLLGPDLKVGDKLKIPYFDPISLTGKDTIIEYKGIDKVLVQDRIYTLHHFTESYAGVRISTWLDNTGKVVKEESPAGFVFISEPEFKATDIVAKGDELLRRVAVPLTGTMPKLAGATQMRYVLTLPEGVEFALDKDRQRLTGNLLTVTLENLADHDADPCQGRQAELAATPYIQAKNPLITELAATVTRDAESAMAKVRRLAAWVYYNLEKRPVLGIPDALTTLQTRRGDCNEHAALFTALARSVGIPTRVAAGVTLHQGAFYYHAWNEVCLGDNWLSLDTTQNQLPADLTHIKFVEGEIKDMVKIGALLNTLQIKVMPPPREVR
jgi:transglutaminase-like putative cysteine protease